MNKVNVVVPDDQPEHISEIGLVEFILVIRKVWFKAEKKFKIQAMLCLNGAFVTYVETGTLVGGYINPGEFHPVILSVEQ